LKPSRRHTAPSAAKSLAPTWQIIEAVTLLLLRYQVILETFRELLAAAVPALA